MSRTATPARRTLQAPEDITGIRDFIARDAPGYADVVVDRNFESTESGLPTMRTGPPAMIAAALASGVAAARR